MDNSMSARPRSTLRGDPYRAYEALPAEVRRALQEALVDWCPLRAREWHLDLLRRQRLQPAQAASALVQTIRRQDHAEIGAFARAWRTGPQQGAEGYPHLAAGATLQRYAGTSGIPAAEPAIPPPPVKRAQPAIPAEKNQPAIPAEKNQPAIPAGKARPATPAKAPSVSRGDPRAAARPGKPAKARPEARPKAKRGPPKRRRARR